jgi:hypothetical protein
MKTTLFLLFAPFLLFASQKHHFKEKSKSEIRTKIADNSCSKLLDEAFSLTINKDKHRIDYGYYGSVVSKVAFTDFCNYSMNERMNLLICLAYFQEWNASTVIGTTFNMGINKKFKPLFLLLATTEYTHDSLIKIRSTEKFLSKLDNAHRNIYLKIESYAKKIKNKDELKRKISSYYGYIFSRNWFYGKYKKYYIKFM